MNTSTGTILMIAVAWWTATSPCSAAPEVDLSRYTDLSDTKADTGGFLKALGEVDSGGRLFFNGGTVYLDRTITVRKSLSLTGTSRVSCKVVFTDPAAGILFLDESGPEEEPCVWRVSGISFTPGVPGVGTALEFRCRSVHNNPGQTAAVENCALTGSRTEYFKRSVVFHNAPNSLVGDTILAGQLGGKKGTASHLLYEGDCSGLLVRNVFARSCRDVCTVKGRSSGIRLLNNFFTQCDNASMFINTGGGSPGQGVVVMGSHYQAYRYGVAAVKMSNISVIGNNIAIHRGKNTAYASSAGVYLENSRAATIVGNTLGATAAGKEYGIGLKDSEYCTVTGNTLHRCETGVRSTGTAKRIVLANNLYLDCKTDAAADARTGILRTNNRDAR